MIEISTDKVVHIIYQSRESGRSADAEVHAFIDGLNEDEKAHLTALAWVGRGAFEAGAYLEAVATARSVATVPTDKYLLDMPHMAENLEAGLEAMGVDVTGEEEDFL